MKYEHTYEETIVFNGIKYTVEKTTNKTWKEFLPLAWSRCGVVSIRYIESRKIKD